MWKMLSIKIDPEMKKALEELADNEFSSVSTLVKQAIDKYLHDKGIDWRDKKKSKK